MKKKNLLVAALAIFGFAPVTLAQTVPSYLPTNGLVGWWPFNGNANDESGNGNNGTVNGAFLANDRNGKSNSAYNFDGIDDVIQTNKILSNITSLTISAWVKTNTGGYAVSQGIHTGGIELFIHNASSGGIGSNEGKVCFYESISGGGFGSISNNTFLDNQWHHFIGVLNGYTTTNLSPDSMKIYVDGVLIAQSNVTTSIGYLPSNPGHPIWLGAAILSNSFLLGSLDDIGIWDRALTQEEITTIYEASTNVGINVANPQYSLHVRDVLKLEPRNTAPPNPTKGLIYFDGILNKLRVYDGTIWQNCW